MTDIMCKKCLKIIIHNYTIEGWLKDNPDLHYIQCPYCLKFLNLSDVQ